MKYKDWLEIWLNNYIKPANKNRTFERYSQLVRIHILTELGFYELDDLSFSVLQTYVAKLLENGNKRTGKPLSANTVNCIITIIQSSLKMAKLAGFSKEYVASNIVRPKIVEKEVSCFSTYEQKKIEEYILSSKKLKLYGILISLYTGLRIGELLALTWTDIDLAKCYINVNKTCYDSQVNGKLEKVIDSPKTSTSKRLIPFPKQLLPFFKKLKAENKCEFVISQNNTPVGIRSYQRSCELLLKKIKVKHKGFHTLRHTFATRALECGMDVKTLSELLGHKNTNITLYRYAHSLMEHKQDMMNKLGKIMICS